MPSSLPRSSASPSALTVHLTAEPATLDPGAVAALLGHLTRQGDDLVQCCRRLAGGRGARQAEALATLLERAATGDVRAGVLLERQVRRLRDMLVQDTLDAPAATGPLRARRDGPPRRALPPPRRRPRPRRGRWSDDARAAARPGHPGRPRPGSRSAPRRPRAEAPPGRLRPPARPSGGPLDAAARGGRTKWGDPS